MRRNTRFAWLLAVVPIAALGFAGTGAAAPPSSTDLKITKTGSPDPVKVGSTLTYTIQVQNLGPNAATGVVVTDQLPKGIDFVSATSTAGTCTQQGQKVTCNVGGIGTGTAANVGSPTVTIKVIPRQAGTITNTATVKADQKDSVSANDSATATTMVLAVTPKAATCQGVTATIKGTGGNDQLTGTGGRDVIVAFGGNDTIAALAGKDLVCAGNGDDYVGAGSAADRVFGGAGKDRLIGRGGPDVLKGGIGNDVLKGNAGADRVFGGAGKDRLIGQGGPDVLKGGTGNDVLKGNAGADRLRGGRGFDRCRGGAGVDSIRSCEA